MPTDDKKTEQAIKRYMNRPEHVKRFVIDDDTEEFWTSMFLSGIAAPVIGMVVAFLFAAGLSIVTQNPDWPQAGTYAMYVIPSVFSLLTFFVTFIEPRVIYPKPFRSFDANQEHVARTFYSMTPDEQNMARPAFIRYMTALDTKDRTACSTVWNATVDKLSEQRQLMSALEGGPLDKIHEIEDYNTQLRVIVEERAQARKELESRRVF